MKKVIVANRGEIACRIIRSLKEMEITAVAVFSEADRNSKAVQMADEAYCIGPAPSAQSYLLGDKIIALAKEIGADGIHPGYGFLSENADFATSVEQAGINFIGPSAHSITIMGSKLAAKEAVGNYNIPMLSGTKGAVTSVAEASKAADKIGYPVLIKASAGGGGKGMRVVESADQFEEQMTLAMNEARSAFGDDSVFVEKFLPAPRHIEIQILSDKHDNYLYLFERECSIQRRHQKVVEEAPSVCLTPELRKQMGESACDVARSCKYFGAGTVEFLLDETGKYFFLEMNTRLQVEHPVTELITGIDLVEEQVRVARGEKLRYKQEDLSINGHAIEVRVYAEDPRNNFLPDIGKLLSYKVPMGPNVRVDDAYQEGQDIPIYYDPMIAKLIVWSNNRDSAIAKMKRAINEYTISGIETTLSFGEFVMNHPKFVAGDIDTQFVKKYFDPKKLDQKIEAEERLAARLAVKLWTEKSVEKQVQSSTTGKAGAWKSRIQHN